MHNIIQETAVEGMMKGVKLCADLIRPTYGGAGTNIVIESKLYPFHMVVNDAQSVIQTIYTKDPSAKIGVDFIKELCDKADKVSGDARKTTILMADTLLEEGHKYTGNKLQLKRDLDSLISVVENEIDQQTKSITVNDVYGVATTASESPEIGNLFKEIYPQIGKNGIINIEGSKTYETTYTITDGVRFEGTGMLSPDMVHDEQAKTDKVKETKAVYENPRILVTKRKIQNDDDINPLLKELGQGENRNLVIFTQDMDSNVASMLIGLHKAGGFTDKFGNFTSMKLLIVKAPTLWQNEVFEDFAKCVGATIVEDATGVTFKNLKLEYLGTCGRIEVDTDDTVITGIKDITEHCKHLQAKGDEISNLRLSWLASKSAILKLGANSETDLSYKRLKCNDANRSTYLALQYGVVKGGGICLYDISSKLPDTEAGKILCKALQAPLLQAKTNYGISHEDYIKLLTENIVDASMVIKRAVRNAVGIASTILTAPALVHLPIKTPEEVAYEVAMKQNNPFNQ